MRLLFFCAVILGSPLLPATAQATNSDAAITAPAAPGNTANGGRITGHVTCDDTRRPARGALVMLLPIPPPPGGDKIQFEAREAMTHVRADGSYTAEHLAPGEYTVLATSPGYLSPLTDILSQKDAINDPARRRELLAGNGTVVLRGSDSASFDITLHRGAAISGQVLYSDGAPAASVSLVLEESSSKPETAAKSQEEQMSQALAQRFFSQQSMSTDDQGHFRLAGLNPGSYRLAAVQSVTSGNSDAADNAGVDMISSLIGVPDGHGLRFYAGDTPHRAAAKTFDLKPGDEMSGIQITLPLDVFHEIRGTLTAKDGRIINQGQLTLTDTADPQFTLRTAVASDGTFAIAQIPAGNYTLAASNARITEPTPNSSANIPDRFRPRIPVAAFADASQSILVQDHDVEGISVTVSEVPLPKDETAQTGQPAQDDIEP